MNNAANEHLAVGSYRRAKHKSEDKSLFNRPFAYESLVALLLDAALVPNPSGAVCDSDVRRQKGEVILDTMGSVALLELGKHIMH